MGTTARPSRAIFVLGVHGSGTSAVAGALLRLGVMMGEVLAGAEARTNPKGHYEDKAFRELLHSHLYHGGEFEPLEAFVRARFGRYPLWGVKEPSLILAMERLAPMLEGRDYRVVCTERDRLATARSYNFKWAHQRIESNLDLQERMLAEREAFIERRTPPALRIAFNELTESPEREIRRLAEFVYEGIKPPDEARIAKAAAFIDPSLNHRRELEGGPPGEHPSSVESKTD